MARDGVDPSGFDNLDPEDTKGAAGQGAGAAIDPKYEKYHRMLKNGVPRIAVDQAMVRDGVDPKGFDKPYTPGDVGNGSSESGGASVDGGKSKDNAEEEATPVRAAPASFLGILRKGRR